MSFAFLTCAHAYLLFTPIANPCSSSPDFVPAVPHQWQPRWGQDQPLNIQLRHWTESVGAPELHHGDWWDFPLLTRWLHDTTVHQCPEATHSFVYFWHFTHSKFHSSVSISLTRLHTGCRHHLRAPTVPAALSETGNVPRGDQHEPLPEHGRLQPGVRGAAGAAEARLRQLRQRQQLWQLQPLPQRLQLILPSCTRVRPVQQSVYHVR